MYKLHYACDLRYNPGEYLTGEIGADGEYLCPFERDPRRGIEYGWGCEVCIHRLAADAETCAEEDRRDAIEAEAVTV